MPEPTPSTAASPAPNPVAPAPKPAVPSALAKPAPAAIPPKPGSLASQAKPAVVKAPTPAQAAQAAALAKRKETSRHYSIRGAKWMTADSPGQLQAADLPAAEKALVSSKIQALNATAVSVDIHSFQQGDSFVVHAHISKIL